MDPLPGEVLEDVAEYLRDNAVECPLPQGAPETSQAQPAVIPLPPQMRVQAGQFDDSWEDTFRGTQQALRQGRWYSDAQQRSFEMSPAMAVEPENA